MNTQQIEKFSFAHIQTLQQWEDENSEIIEEAIRRCMYRHTLTAFLIEIADKDACAFYDEMQHKGDTLKDRYQRCSPREKRIYNTFEYLHDDAIVDTGYYMEDIENLNDTNDKILDMWEEKEKKYAQEIVCKYYYLSLVFTHIREMYELYKESERKRKRKAEMNKEKFKEISFFQWYFEQERNNQ